MFVVCWWLLLFVVVCCLLFDVCRCVLFVVLVFRSSLGLFVVVR